MAKVKENDAQKDFCAYIGPTLLGVIQKGTIIDGTKEDACKLYAQAIKAHPLIKSLIVPGKDLAEANLNIKRPDSILYVNYHKLASGKF